MNLGSDARTIGRYVVDIDGCLRATDHLWLSAAGIAQLHGGTADGVEIIWDRPGEAVVLGEDDRIEMDEGTVQFFRTSPKPVRVRASGAHVPFGTARRLGATLLIAA